MTALPVLPDGAVCVVGADLRLSVNPNSEHVNEALMIVENLCTRDTLDSLAEQLGKVSSAKGNKAATLPQAEKLVSCLKAARFLIRTFPCISTHGIRSKISVSSSVRAQKLMNCAGNTIKYR